MNKQLLPCPFCGGNSYVDQVADGFSVTCFSCGSRGANRSTEERAVTRWNTRHEPKPSSKSKGTYKEVAEFCKSIGLPESDAEYFFNKCEGCGWTNGGKPIKDWRATIRSWKAAGYMPSCKMTVVPNKATIPKWKQIQAIEEQLETHPANPSFRSYRADKVTPEQKEHYENQKANLKRLKGELI